MDSTQLQQTKEQVTKLVSDCQAIVAEADGSKRDLSEDDTAKMDAVQDEIDNLNEAVRMQENENRRARLDKQAALLSKPQERKVPPGPYSEKITSSDVKVFAKRKSLGKLRGYDTEKQAYTAGMWLKAQLGGDEKARQWCGWNCDTRVLVVGTNATAGFLVPDEFESAIIMNREDFGIARQVCRVVSMGSDVLNIPQWLTSPAAVWVQENANLTLADPTFGQVQLTAAKLSRLTQVSSEMFEDSAIDLAAWLAMDIARAFAEAEDDALFNGDNTNSFGGIHGIAQQFDDDNNLVGAIDTPTASADEFSDLALQDISALIAGLPLYALSNAKFYISQRGFSESMEAIAHAGGGSTAVTLSDFRVENRFMGYPVIKTNKMPTTAGSLNNQAMILFGDMEAAVVLGDRRQIRLSVLTELYALADNIGIKATERIDIQAHGVGTTVTGEEGPIVALIGTS